MIIAGTWPLELTVHSQTSHPLDNNTQIQVTTARFHRSTALYRFSDYFDESVDLYAHGHTVPKVRYKAMLLLIYIDTISCAEASFHPIPAAVTKGVQPDPKLNHNDNVYQHTQTHKYNQRCAMQAAMLPSAAAPLSTINAPPLVLPTPWLIINLKLNRLHRCINPARTCAAAAAVTQDCARLRALLQRKKVRNVPTQKLRRPPPNCRDDRRHHHSTARCGARSCGAPMPQQLSIELQHRADAMRIEFGVE